MAESNSAQTHLENTQDGFGSVSWVSDQLSNPLPDDMDFNEQVWFSAESKRISDMINKLENGLVSQKDKEIDQLKTQLARLNGELLHLATKVLNLKRYLVWENKEFGILIGNLAEIGSKNITSSGPVLIVGPFSTGNEVDEVQGMLNELSIKLKSGVDKRNHELLRKINHLLLKSKGLDIPVNPTVATSTATGTTTDNDMGHIPSFKTPPSTNPKTAFIVTPGGMPNTAVPAWRQLDYHSSNVFSLPGRRELSLINSSVLNFKHGIDLTKLDMGFFCLCGAKSNSAESLGQHLIVSAEQ